MSRTSVIFFVFLFLISCSIQKGKKERQTSEMGSTEVERLPAQIKNLEAAPVEEVPSLAHSWDAEVYMVNFNQEEEAKIHKAVELIKNVIKLKEFKDRVLNYTYDGKKQFFDNAGVTNEEVYQRILDGAEQMGNKNKNNMMDVELELYNEKTSTIGYTFPNTVRIWMNRKYFQKYNAVKVADNLMHEWMHKIGFVHATTWSESRDHSVPYAIGYLVEELAGKYFKE